MTASNNKADTALSMALLQRIDDVVDRFAAAREAGEHPSVEDFLKEFADTEQPYALSHLLAEELHTRCQKGESPTREEYERRFEDHIDVVRHAFAEQHVKVGETVTFSETPAGDASLEEPTPDGIGRYQIRRRLGEGGFGYVYLGYDQDLQREVAIKVPRPERISEAADVEAYLKEARLVATLDHSHIVPVYDVGRTKDNRCFVVSKYIEGSDLRQQLKERRFSHREAAALVATIADALHHAHREKIVHRDIKPANILIDNSGNPYVADFGLALKDEDLGKGSGYAGTPAYMSPEQARGEGHLVDGRSDIFSLGVVLFELLTRERPFTGSSWDEVADRIKTLDVRPPRQLDESIPKELERICLKAVSKRAADRYSTAVDLAEDLRYYLEEEAPEVAAETPKVFISYRREDSDLFAGRLCEHLQGHFGQEAVFFDVVSIPFGMDFPQHISKKLRQCDVVLAVIGPKWLAKADDGSRRIDGKQDYVRIEIETALNQQIPVIPILVANTPMPVKDELPPSIKKLVDMNACRIDTGIDFSVHVERLVSNVNRTADQGSEQARAVSTHRRSEVASGRKRWTAPVVWFAGVGSLAVFSLIIDRLFVASPEPPETPLREIDSPPTSTHFAFQRSSHFEVSGLWKATWDKKSEIDRESLLEGIDALNETNEQMIPVWLDFSSTNLKASELTWLEHVNGSIVVVEIASTPAALAHAGLASWMADNSRLLERLRSWNASSNVPSGVPTNSNSDNYIAELHELPRLRELKVIGFAWSQQQLNEICSLPLKHLVIGYEHPSWNVDAMVDAINLAETSPFTLQLQGRMPEIWNEIHKLSACRRLTGLGLNVWDSSGAEMSDEMWDGLRTLSGQLSGILNLRFFKRSSANGTRMEPLSKNTEALSELATWFQNHSTVDGHSIVHIDNQHLDDLISGA